MTLIHTTLPIEERIAKLNDIDVRNIGNAVNYLKDYVNLKYSQDSIEAVVEIDSLVLRIKRNVNAEGVPEAVNAIRLPIGNLDILNGDRVFEIFKPGDAYDKADVIKNVSILIRMLDGLRQKPIKASDKISVYKTKSHRVTMEYYNINTPEVDAEIIKLLNSNKNVADYILDMFLNGQVYSKSTGVMHFINKVDNIEYVAEMESRGVVLKSNDHELVFDINTASDIIRIVNDHVIEFESAFVPIHMFTTAQEAREAIDKSATNLKNISDLKIDFAIAVHEIISRIIFLDQRFLVSKKIVVA